LNPVVEAIKTRRSVKNVDLKRTPSPETIKQILEAATWAPNHHMTEPWRFVVIANEHRLKLGESMAAALKGGMRTIDESQIKEVLRVERDKALRAPVIIALICSQKSGERIVPQEEMIAAGAALQNLLLATHSLGLGAIVRTGPHAYSQPVRDYLDLAEKELLIGFIYLGYPVDSTPPASKRTSVDSKVQWRGLLPSSAPS